MAVFCVYKIAWPVRKVTEGYGPYRKMAGKKDEVGKMSLWT